MQRVLKLCMVVMALVLAFSLVGVASAGAEVPNVYTAVEFAAGDGVWGYNEAIDIGFGESVSMQFDVYESSINARWAFYVTENDVTTNASGGHNYKAKATNVLGFSTTAGGGAAAIMDWFGGTSYGKSFSAGTFFQAGMSYKFVYTTASSATATDGMMEIFLCETAKVGTTSEKWECYMYNRNFGDTSSASYDFHPTNDIHVGIWTNGGNISMKVGNVKIATSDGLKADETDLTAYGAVTMENVRPVPVAEVTTNPQIYIGDYDGGAYTGMAHIIFGTTTNPNAEYGVILTTSQGVSYLFEGKNIGTNGKYGIAIYNIPEGDYTVKAYAGPGDNRTYGDETTFTAGKASYTVTYDFNGGEGTYTSEQVAQGTAAVEPTTVPTLKGATFSHWVDENGDEYDFSKIVTKDMTLSAVFESNYGGEAPKKYISTSSGQYIGVNENTAITFGDVVTWQFDVLAYYNPGVQFRLCVSDATAASGMAMSYKYASGYKSQVMGKAANGANDWYGGANLITSRTNANMFSAGYSYKLVYTAPSAAYTADASFILYECATASVGAGDEAWTEIMKTTGFGNTEGGNGFAPYTAANMNIYFGGEGMEFGITNSTYTVNKATTTPALYVSSGMDSDYAPYVKYSTQKRVLFSSTGYWGYKEGVNIGYGGELAMQFDVISASINGRWAFTVTNDSLDTNPRGYKDPYQGNILGYTALNGGAANAIGDWYYGDISTSRTAKTAFVPGYTYKAVYKAATGDSAADGSFVLYECLTALVGTPYESWTDILAVRNFDNSAAGAGGSPVSDVKICLWTNAANGVDLVVDNAKVTASTGLSTGALATNANVSVTPLEYSEPKTDLAVSLPANTTFGLLDAGIDVGYGQSLVYEFTFANYRTPSWIGFFVTDGNVKADYLNALANKGAVANHVAFVPTSYDWGAGTHEGSMVGNGITNTKYRIIYTAPSAAGASDAILRFQQIDGDGVNWNTRNGVTGFGAANAPMSDVRIGIVIRGAAASFDICDGKVILPNGTVITSGFTGSSGVTIQAK